MSAELPAGNRGEVVVLRVVQEALDDRAVRPFQGARETNEERGRAMRQV